MIDSFFGMEMALGMPPPGGGAGDGEGGGGIYSRAPAHLGIDPLAEKELLWIAQHATTARLPAHWVEKVINRGEENQEKIFLNEVTREQRRESPVLSRCRKLVARLKVVALPEMIASRALQRR